jgi:hypothetical protein
MPKEGAPTNTSNNNEPLISPAKVAKINAKVAAGEVHDIDVLTDEGEVHATAEEKQETSANPAKTEKADEKAEAPKEKKAQKTKTRTELPKDEKREITGDPTTTKKTKENALMDAINSNFEKGAGGGKKGDTTRENVLEQHPHFKLEGETYTIKNERTGERETFVIGKRARSDGTVFEATNLTTGKPTTIDEVLIKSAANEKREDLRADFRNRFGFTEDDIETLEKNKDFQNLSVGQKRFVMESLTSTTIEKVDEVAESRFKQEQSSKNIFVKGFNNFFKNTKMAGVKKRAFDDLRTGGYKEHEATIATLIDRVKIMNSPIIENEKGELEIQFSAAFADKLKNDSENGPAAIRAQRAFNQAATALNNIPPAWEAQSASRDQRNAAAEAKRIFEIEKAKCRDFLDTEKFGEEGFKKTFIETSGVEDKVELNRLMNAHPENERVLLDLKRNLAEKGLDRAGLAFNDALMKEHRGVYMGAGWLARGATTYFDNAAAFAAGAFGGIVGGIRGIGKARTKIRDNEAQMRLGGKNTLAQRDASGKKIGDNRLHSMEVKMTEIKNEKDDKGHKGYIQKINDIVAKVKIAEEKGNTDEVAFYSAMLKKRMDYAVERAKNGKVTFGNKENRISNQMAFLDAIKKAETTTIGTDPENIKKYEDRMQGLLNIAYGNQETAEKKARMGYITKFAVKNGIIGAAFGVAGYIARDVHESLKESGFYSATWEAMKGVLGGSNTAETMAAAAAKIAEAHTTHVAMPTPESGELTGGKNIDSFFNKGAETPEGSIDNKNIPTIEKPEFEGIHVEARDNTYVEMDDPTDVQFEANQPVPESMPGYEDIANEDVAEKLEIPADAYIKKGEGIEHALRRQIENNPDLAKQLGWNGDPNDTAGLRKFSGNAAHKLAISEGYVDPKTGNEVRVNFGGDKNAFYEIKQHEDGTIRINEGRGTIYTETEATDRLDKLTPTERQMNHGQEYEYIYKNGEKIPVINQSSLPTEEAASVVETREKYFANLAEENAAAAAAEASENTAANIPVENIAIEDDATQGIAMEDTSAGDEAATRALAQQEAQEAAARRAAAQQKPRVGRNIARKFVAYETRQPHGYPTRGGGGGRNIYNPGGVNGPRMVTGAGRTIYQPGGRAMFNAAPMMVIPEQMVTTETNYGIPVSNNGTFVKVETINGENIYRDTLSTDPTTVFDPRVNRQYDRLIEETFGEHDIVSRDTMIDKNISKMLENNLAENDIHSVGAEGASENTKEYYDIVDKIHKASGLEPKEGQPTGVYLRQALQKMKDDGKNIRKFVSGLISNDEDAVVNANNNVKIVKKEVNINDENLPDNYK